MARGKGLIAYAKEQHDAAVNAAHAKRVRKRVAKTVPTETARTPAPGIDTSTRDSYAQFPSQLVIVASAEVAGEIAAWAHEQRKGDVTRAKAVILRELLEAGLKVMRPRYEKRYGKLLDGELSSAVEHERTDGARARRAARMRATAS